MEIVLTNCSLHRFEPRSDQRGNLVAIEAERDVPFEIRRVYYLYNTPPEEERGFHGHRELEQLAVCLAGAVTITLDDGHERRDVRMDSPEKALFIGRMIWREMRDFTPNAVLMVLASAPYDEADYIRDYADFLASVVEERGQ